MRWLERLTERLRQWADDLEARRNTRAATAPIAAATSLEDMIDCASGPLWTEEELVEWLNALPDKERYVLLDLASKGRSRGLDPHDLMCKLRIEWERVLGDDPRRRGPGFCSIFTKCMEGSVLSDMASGKLGVKVN